MVHLLLGLQLIVGLGDAGAVEGVGLDDVGAGLQISQVDGLNNVRACNDQQVIVALQLVAVGFEALTPEVLLLQLVFLDLCPHGPVDEHDALLEQRLELPKHRGTLERVHIMLVARGSRRPGQARVPASTTSSTDCSVIQLDAHCSSAPIAPLHTTHDEARRPQACCKQPNTKLSALETV